MNATDSPAAVRHPAKFSAAILTELRDILEAEAETCSRWFDVFDPFAGVGGVHDLADEHYNIRTTGVELEPEWAHQHEHTMVGSALDLPWRDGYFDAVVTSPCYGNRMADHHEAKDDSMRNTYRHALGRMPSEDSAAVMQWGDDYRDFHEAALFEMHRVLRPGGLLVINISNHIRAGHEQLVVEWWLETILQALGHRLVEVRRVATPRLRYGQNHQARVDAEHIIVTRKGTS